MISPTGREHIHRRDGSAVVVEAHVERLDLLGVVHDHHRPLRVFLAEVALMLGLEGDAPFDRELEGPAGPLEDVDGLGVSVLTRWNRVESSFRGPRSSRPI
jgi:hypothetical protein